MTNKVSRRDYMIAASSVGLSSFSGCTGGSTSQFSLAASVYPVTAGSMDIIVGIEEGIFEEHGLNVEDVVSFGSGPQVVRGISTGGIDVGRGGLLAATEAYLAGAPIQITGIAIGSTPISFMAKDESIQTIEDLSGKIVAIPGKGGTTHASLVQAVINTEGLALSSIEIVGAGGMTESHTMVEHGDADAAMAVPAAKLKLLQENWHVVFHFTEKEDWLPAQVFQMGIPMLENDFNKASNIMEAFIEARGYVQNHMEEAAEFWAEQNQFSTSTAKKGLADISSRDKNLNRLMNITPNEPYFRNISETMISLGSIDEPPKWNEIIRQDVLPEKYRAAWLE